jgi:hypothetical protein
LTPKVAKLGADMPVVEPRRTILPTREVVNASPDRQPQLVAHRSVATATLEDGVADANARAVSLKQLLMPLALIASAAVLTWFLATNAGPRPHWALFSSWFLCAAASVTVVSAVQSPLKNEVGRDDAAHLFTISWFVLLTSAMAAGSLWNVFVWDPKSTELSAFVKIPPEVWILGGIAILSNVGVRAAFALSPKQKKYDVQSSPNRVSELMTLPLDSEGSGKMAAAQYVVFNVLGLVVYGVAIARLFGTVVGSAQVGAFPKIPSEVLGLMAVSGAGLVISSTVPSSDRSRDPLYTRPTE